MIWTGLIPLLPLLAALAIGGRMALGAGRRGDADERGTARLAIGSVLAALILLLVADGIALVEGAPGAVSIGTWLDSGAFRIPVGLLLDGLSLPLATLVAVIALLTLRFSVNYLHREAGFHRFFFGMTLFTSGMLTVVLADNAVLAFTGWELAGISSYLLIGYAYERPTATGNAVRAVVTNRIGDAGFLLGIVLSLLWLGGVEWSVIAAGGELGTLALGVLVLGFVIAALAKSALVPFAPWVARALEGPTPSSAIFYGSLMIHAGVYLLLRLEPVLTRTPLVMAALAAVGLLTALYGWLVGRVQGDVKSRLMFATTAHVGLMVLACGLGWFTLAAWYLALHASWRAFQFLLAPSWLELTSPTPWRRDVSGWLHGAASHRFWLEGLGDWLLVRPTRALARDVNRFDRRVVNRLVGQPQVAAPGASLVRGYGAAGRLLQWFADLMHVFEQRLVFRGDGALSGLIRRLGGYLLAAEGLLERPVYLLLLIMATFAVIL